MSHNFQLNANFCAILNKIDQEFAEQTRQQGCIYCGGTLHKADYPRTPFGIPAHLRDNFSSRYALCCGTCRKRTTVPSVRFLGRYRYPGTVFILITALRLGFSERRLAQVRQHLSIDIKESTWKRWRRWWRETFIATAYWRQAKGLFVISSETSSPLARVLLKSFHGNLAEKMLLFLRFLSPLTAGEYRAV